MNDFLTPAIPLHIQFGLAASPSTFMKAMAKAPAAPKLHEEKHAHGTYHVEHHGAGMHAVYFTGKGKRKPALVARATGLEGAKQRIADHTAQHFGGTHAEFKSPGESLAHYNKKSDSPDLEKAGTKFRVKMPHGTYTVHSWREGGGGAHGAKVRAPGIIHGVDYKARGSQTITGLGGNDHTFRSRKHAMDAIAAHHKTVAAKSTDADIEKCDDKPALKTDLKKTKKRRGDDVAKSGQGAWSAKNLKAAGARKVRALNPETGKHEHVGYTFKKRAPKTTGIKQDHVGLANEASKRAIKLGTAGAHTAAVHLHGPLAHHFAKRGMTKQMTYHQNMAEMHLRQAREAKKSTTGDDLAKSMEKHMNEIEDIFKGINAPAGGKKATAKAPAQAKHKAGTGNEAAPKAGKGDGVHRANTRGGAKLTSPDREMGNRPKKDPSTTSKALFPYAGTDIKLAHYEMEPEPKAEESESE